ncbi:MAG: phosphoglycolate phosphatase [Gammaproteobacteria bacterium]|nr:phosphoglycolate phosphatase [Gammaproteobacteria bacterium]MDH5692114.1 phosphoglycolate phosphatase [Gammaproteobacteria bacterium]
MFENVKVMLIDLDGTLVDSVPDLAWAGDQMMAELGLPQNGEAAARNWVGNGVPRFIMRQLTGELHQDPEAALYEKAEPIFHKYYHEINGKKSCLFPGVKEGLEKLEAAGIKLGCVTNKAEAFTLPLLESLGVLGHFGVVVSGDTLPVKKPDPRPLLHGIEKLGGSPDNSLMVGDSQHDVEAARNARMRVIAVPYGYNHGEDVRDAKPDAVVESLADIPALLK